MRFISALELRLRQYRIYTHGLAKQVVALYHMYVQRVICMYYDNTFQSYIGMFDLHSLKQTTENEFIIT